MWSKTIISITITPNISSSATDCHGISINRTHDIGRITISATPIFLNFVNKSEIPIVAYAIEAIIKNHMETKSWG